MQWVQYSLSVKSGLHWKTIFSYHFRSICFPHLSTNTNQPSAIWSQITWCQYVKTLFLKRDSSSSYYPTFSFLVPRDAQSLRRKKMNILQRTGISLIAFTFLVMYRQKNTTGRPSLVTCVLELFLRNLCFCGKTVVSQKGFCCVLSFCGTELQCCGFSLSSSQ